MNLTELAAVCGRCGAELTPDVPLSTLTTFKVGGPCRALVTLPDLDAVRAVTEWLRETGTPHRLIGRGSNLLARDDGYEGVVLKLGGMFTDPPAVSGNVISCGAGVSLKDLCMAALHAGLTGLEFAYGIPGAVGGAVFMNAGAYGGEMSQVLESVIAMDNAGELHTVPAEDMALRYRHSVFMENGWLILGASVRLRTGDPAAIQAQMQELLGRRKDKQPLEYPSAGSTFKRPEGSYASKLIDECGLKGCTVGGAQVSEKHAGFVINRGGATFADIMALCGHVRETVQAQTGFVLELEPEIL